MENNKFVPVAIVIVGILIAGAIYFRPTGAPVAGNNNAASGPDAAKALLAKMSPVSAKEHVQGASKPIITVIEYSDLECPFCKAYQWTMDEMMTKYGAAGTNQVTWVFRQFPLVSLHSKATEEAEAAECAAKIGGNEKFWQYIDKIYSVTPSNNGLDSALLPKTATDLGIDAAKFATCMKNHEAKAALDAQVKDATNIQVDGTPFVVLINSKGEKLLPFYEKVPTTWSSDEQKIVNDLLASYDASIKKLRGQAQ